MREGEDGLQCCLSFPGKRRQMVLPDNGRAPERVLRFTQVEGQTARGPET